MSVRFNIEQDTARPRLRALRSAVGNVKRINRAGAEGMLGPIEASLQGMASTNHNPFGVRSSFWNQMLSGTHAGVDDEGGYVSMPRPVALRAFGGTVFPKQSKYLAIPAREEAYNKSPKDFSDLQFILLPTGRFGQGAALVQKPLPDGLKTRGRKRDAQGRGSIAPRELGDMVFYWLVPQATIAPDADVLPTTDQLRAGAERGVQAYMRQAIAKQGGTES